MREQVSFVQLVLSRLERISADSPLAHRASGLRGSLLRWLEKNEKGLGNANDDLERSLNMALEILNQAAGGRPNLGSPSAKTIDAPLRARKRASGKPRV